MWWPLPSQARSRLKKEVSVGPGNSWVGVGVGTDTHPLPALAADTMDFSGLSLIKLKKQEMETQVRAYSSSGTELRAGGEDRP